jgi:hypothetical protein
MYVDIKQFYCLFLLFTTLNDYSCYKVDNQDKKKNYIKLPHCRNTTKIH